MMPAWAWAVVVLVLAATLFAYAAIIVGDRADDELDAWREELEDELRRKR